MANDFIQSKTHNTNTHTHLRRDFAPSPLLRSASLHGSATYAQTQGKPGQARKLEGVIC
jgi:hypothetical protein